MCALILRRFRHHLTQSLNSCVDCKKSNVSIPTETWNMNNALSNALRNWMLSLSSFLKIHIFTHYYSTDVGICGHLHATIRLFLVENHTHALLQFHHWFEIINLQVLQQYEAYLKKMSKLYFSAIVVILVCKELKIWKTIMHGNCNSSKTELCQNFGS